MKVNPLGAPKFSVEISHVHMAPAPAAPVITNRRKWSDGHPSNQPKIITSTEVWARIRRRPHVVVAGRFGRLLGRQPTGLIEGSRRLIGQQRYAKSALACRCVIGG